MMAGSEKRNRKLSSKPDSEVIQAFKLFDQDNDGKIKSSEISGLVTAMGGQVDCPNVLELMKQCDQRETHGGLDVQEFMKHWKVFKQKVEEDDEDEEEIQEAFRTYDIDGDGYITKEEMKAFLTKMGFIQNIEEEAEKCVADMDIDGDGRVSYAEFLVKWRTF